MILTPLQKLPSNEGNLGKIIVATSFECLPKKQKKSPNLVTLKLYSDPSSYSECSLVIVSIKYIEEIRYYG